ncbi:tail fiber protein [Bacillus phage CAM003]|uniref:Uncharacterized protein n=2 Tax=Bastillevirus TaxID=1918010 RepID=A0A024B1X7_9CAUD|nr:tail fiber protein [Bacillus phage Hoody T]YP_009036983.1 tail fiber protein [Bacillus phage CAM003]AHZ09517.1 hypothetical protein [Bacillus phage CAM003]AHZ10392.1 hypothetical protein [Bacillus phage Hoody T]
MYNNPMHQDGTQYQHNNEKLIDLDKIEELNLADYGFTVDAVKMNHFGIDVTDPRTKQPMPDAFYEASLEKAIAQVEKMLDIVILPRYNGEHHDYYRNDFESFMFIRTRQRPVLQMEKVTLEYGGGTVFNYPTKWWRVYKLEGQLEMLPTLMLSEQGQSLNLAQVYSGYPMIAGIPNLVGNNYAPQMFHVEYVAGMLPPKRRGVSREYEMPADLWTLVIKVALKEILQQWGRLIVGAGIASMSVNIDGISQSIDTTQSAMYGGASADIMQLDRDIEDLVRGLKSFYGINLGII